MCCVVSGVLRMSVKCHVLRAASASAHAYLRTRAWTFSVSSKKYSMKDDLIGSVPSTTANSSPGLLL